jgi:calcium-translocating P-type ATPase
MLVARVGDGSFLGRISGEIQNETRESPLKIRLSKLARQISVFGYIAAVLCALAYLFNSFVIKSGFDGEVILSLLSDKKVLLPELLHAFTLGLTVVVMAVPEGLPMMIAVVLSSNIKRMVKDNVLVRRAVGIEAAGSVNILFTDKTGTLTEGKMTVGGVVTGDGARLSVSELGKKASAIDEIYRLAAFFGESETVHGKAVGGNITERAMAESVAREKCPEGYFAISRKVFDSERKYSAVRLSGKRNISVIKGAPEVILPYVTSYLTAKGGEVRFNGREAEGLFSTYAAEGWRMLALAVGKGDVSSPDSFGELTLVCGIMIADRPRREAQRSVGELRLAGVQVVMITGDNKDTAIAVAKKCGIYKGSRDVCLTSREMNRMSDGELRDILPELRVVARALPTDKSRLVRLAQESGLVVGMTGDGINDAPALKAADVGFSMGSGTQVAKDAGDIIILDNDLASIVKAVLYGRNIFKSIRKFIVLQLTVNLCAVGVTMIGPFIGVESPVTVVQMLWINIIMDTLGGMAFAGEPALRHCMKEKPKKRDEAILNGYMMNQIALLGTFTVAMCVAFLRSPSIISHFDGGFGGEKHLTAFFAFFIFAGVFNCFNARTDSLYMLRGLGGNKAFIFIMIAVLSIQIGFVYLGGSILRTVPLTARELWYTMSLALLVFPADALRKTARRFSGKRGGY